MCVCVCECGEGGVACQFYFTGTQTCLRNVIKRHCVHNAKFTKIYQITIICIKSNNYM